MTFVPSGNFCIRYPSPSCTIKGGVRSSTSRTNPGLGMGSLSPRSGSVLRRERHLERAGLACGHGVVDGVAPAVEGIGRADELIEKRKVRSGLDREVERGDA